MLGHGGRSAGSYLADPTSPIPSHCAVSKCCSASIVATSTARVKDRWNMQVLFSVSDTSVRYLLFTPFESLMISGYLTWTYSMCMLSVIIMFISSKRTIYPPPEKKKKLTLFAEVSGCYRLSSQMVIILDSRLLLPSQIPKPRVQQVGESACFW